MNISLLAFVLLPLGLATMVRMLKFLPSAAFDLGWGSLSW